MRRIGVGVLLAAALLAASACMVPGGQEAGEGQAMQQLFLFQYAPGPAWRAGAPITEQGLGPHAAYMGELQQRGRLFAGGGYTNADGGMAIVSASGIEEARALLAADPAIVSGVFTAELRGWAPRFRTDAPLP